MNTQSFKRSLKISVVIPLFNKAPHIEETLASIAAQSVKPLEIIIVDDGSTDGGVDNLLQVNNFRLVKQKNAGVSAARNKGIQHARGDYIAFIDADDLWLPQFLEEMCELILSYSEADFFASAYQFQTGDEEYKQAKIRYSKDQTQWGLMKDYFDIGARGDLPFMMSSIVVKQSSLQRLGMFPVGESMGEDQAFFSRFALHGQIAYSMKMLAVYKLDAGERACNRSIPVAPCPFAQRLIEYQLSIEDLELKKSIRAYCVAHIIHLVSLNHGAGRFRTAKSLLQNPLILEANPSRLSWAAARAWWWKSRNFLCL